MSAKIIIFNAGSSSLKFALHDVAGDNENAHARGSVEVTDDGVRFRVRPAGRAPSEASLGKSFSHQAALIQVFDWMSREGIAQELAAAGHRIVHGGGEFVEPVLVDADVLSKLTTYAPMAPMHQPHNLAAITAMAQMRPGLPQIACFDTAFHATLSPLATMFALPRALTEQGIRRYGFHGLSYEYVANALPHHLGDAANGRVVVAHLGHGASMCAMRDRKSIATTMGFSALDGLIMGTRSGAIDPGVLLYLLQERGMTPAQLSDMLYTESGLFGMSGESDDVRTLLKSASPAARLAIDLFVHRIATDLGALAAALGGLDVLVFTAGIGENSAEIRARVCEGARWLGAEVSVDANTSGASIFSTTKSKVVLLTLHTNEEAVIARACRKILGRGPADGGSNIG